MKCKDCVNFIDLKLPDGKYQCGLCTGTVVSSDEKEVEYCQYIDQPVTEEFASKKYWLLPFEAFNDRMFDLERLIQFINEKNIKEDIKEELISIIYSQLVTTFEVYFREKFTVGMLSEKGFQKFIASYEWDKKYCPSELYGHMQQIVISEMEKINFQNFSQVGSIFKGAFDIDIFAFPDELKRNINRILRFRHSLIHQGEIWDNHHMIRLTISHLQTDIEVLKEFIGRVDNAFEKNIGTPYNDLVEQGYFGSRKLVNKLSKAE